MKKQDGQTLVINLNLTRGMVTLLILSLLTAALLGYLAWGQEEAAASSPQAGLTASTNMRQYYLTKTYYNGANASTACASGYHMASLWEILDPSNLVYNTALGDDRADSGEGPHTCFAGWVRTGYNGDNSTTPGRANCNVWSGTSGWGTNIRLPSDWTDSTTQDIHVWDVSIGACSSTDRVWCVED